MANGMQLSFIVVTYHRTDLLQPCLNSIYMQEMLPQPYEVIVIDNGGDAQIRSPVPEYVSLKIERPNKNLGVAGGRNLGMECASGQHWIFIDDDAVWRTPGDVARLLADLESCPQCAAIAVKVIDPVDAAVVVALLPHPNKAYLSMASSLTEVPYFYGGAHALKSEAVKKVGYYPSRYIYAMEEVDLSLRFLDAGFKIIYDPSVAIYHSRGASIKGAEYWKRNALNKCRVAWRLLPFPYPVTVMFIWSCASLIRTRSPGIVFQILHALWNERTLLASERHPIRTETVHYLKSVGARLTY